MKYGNYSPWRNYTYSLVTIILLLIIFGVLVRATWNIHQKATLGAIRLGQARAEFDKLTRRQADLAAKVAELSTDDGREAEIRSKYRAVKEGESLAVIVDEDASSTATTSPVIHVSWWSRLLQKIGL